MYKHKREVIIIGEKISKAVKDAREVEADKKRRATLTVDPLTGRRVTIGELEDRQEEFEAGLEADRIRREQKEAENKARLEAEIDPLTPEEEKALLDHFMDPAKHPSPKLEYNKKANKEAAQAEEATAQADE